MRTFLAASLVVLVAGCSGGKDGGGGGGEAGPPELVSVSPASATVGQAIAITGTGFGSEQGDSTVTVGGAAGNVLTWTETEVDILVPDVLPGTRDVAVTVGGDTDSLSLEVKLPRVLYVNDASLTGNSFISAFDVAVNGSLTEMAGSPFDLGVEDSIGFGGDPKSLTVDAAHRRLFVVSSGAVSSFAIDGNTGALTAAGAPKQTGDRLTFGVAVTPDGTSVYVTVCDTGVLHYTVAPDGTLSPAAVPSYSVVGCPDAMAVTPDGANLYLSNDTQYAHFRIGAGGVLTPATVATGTLPGSAFGMSLSPDGSRIYWASYADQTLFGYDIDATTGALTAIPGGPWVVDGVDPEPNGIVFSPTDDVGFVALWNTAGILTVDVAADGVLTPRPGKTAVAIEPSPMVISADGTVLFVLGQESGTVSSFTIDDAGALTEVSGSPIELPPESYPSGVALTGF